MAKKNWKATTDLPDLPELDGDSLLNLFDQDNPDVNMFNLVDDEIIRLSGSKMHFFKSYHETSYDDVYMEARNRPLSKTPLVVHGHYEPVSMAEELGEFGIELTNDQIFTFNKSYIEKKLGREVRPGDVIKPVFQEQRYEIFEAVEDSFEAYGVYHIVCSAKLLRDSDDVNDQHLPDVSDDVGGTIGDC
tara:strand:- start:1203 stop:1769 length:567 start_codon:yes stop_codon:yes gene_type:complete